MVSLMYHVIKANKLAYLIHAMLRMEPEARRHFSAVFTASKLTTGYFLIN